VIIRNGFFTVSGHDIFHGLSGAMFRRSLSVQSRTHRREHICHILHKIVFDLLVVNNKETTILCRE